MTRETTQERREVYPIQMLTLTAGAASGMILDWFAIIVFGLLTIVLMVWALRSGSEVVSHEEAS